jgi:nifR3 family TIM-barrel protein
MKKSQVFWKKLNKPIYALAPMAGITDSAFRQICKDFGADILYSEMASATALNYNPKKTLELLKFSRTERPYIVQLFGSRPEHFAGAVRLIEKKIKPDGFDINFGCPVKKVLKQGAGAALLDNFKLAREVIKTVINNTGLPVSIKLRSKASKVDALKFLDYMSGLDIKAIMIHGRTLKQGFSGPVDFQIIKKARNYFSGIILANGGVNSAEDAFSLLEKTEADGIGIGRGALGRPWIFEEVKSLPAMLRNARRAGQKSVKSKVAEEIFKIALKHAKLAEKLKGEIGIREMRKHLCWYAAGLPNASELRQKLARVESLGDINKIINE